MSPHTPLCLGIFVLLLAGSLLVPSAPADPTALYADELVRIDITAGMPTLPKGVDIAGGVPGQALDIIIPKLREGELSGLKYTVLISDVDAYSQTFAGQYHSFAQIEQILQDTANNYQSITKLTSLGKTSQNRDIWCLEISDNPGVDEGEPGVVFMALHHAREWPGVEITLNLINILTSQYNTNTTIKNLVDNRRLFVVPCVNPDGYYRSHDQGSDWRKNMHYFPFWGTTGVDLNRNYAGSVNGKGLGEWGTVYQGAATHDSSQGVYCGPDPNSELEVQAVQSLVLNNNICAAISWHTYSELVLWPWGYKLSEKTPDNTYLSAVGQHIASLIHRQGSGTYTPQQSAQLYPTTGDFLDWCYGDSYYEMGKSTFCYTIEACNEFQPPANQLDQICAENAKGGLYLLTEAANISQVAPQILPPVIDDMPDSDTGSYTVSWQVPNPSANPDVFQLDEMTNLSTTTDGAESGIGYWVNDGFTVSTQHAHSGTHSFKGHTQDGATSTLTTTTPLPVTPGTAVSFWTYYNTEYQYDYGFFEVGTDGRLFNVLGGFNGTGTTWQQHTYDLSAYAGKSVFLRFRYVTDDGTSLEGFYVDDITPIASFAHTTNVSASITQTHYQFTDRANGTYYYRIRGHTAARGWGDYSTVKSINVVLTHPGNDTTPPTLNITSPKEHFLYSRNHEVRPFFTTLILGSINVTVSTTDESGIARVEFSVNGKLMATDTVVPYSWDWTNRTFGRRIITVVSYDNAGNNATQSLPVWKFF